MGQLLLTLALGAGGWFLANFLAGPIFYFFQLRQTIHSDLIFFGNVLCNMKERPPVDSPQKDLHKRAEEAFRRHSADIQAFRESHKRIEPILKKIRWPSLNLDEAGGLLMALCHSFSERATVNDHLVRKKLCLPPSLSDERISEMQRTLEHSESSG